MMEMRSKELITDRMMALSRNINYFGEFLIYLSFALLPMKWFALIPLGLFITLLSLGLSLPSPYRSGRDDGFSRDI